VVASNVTRSSISTVQNELNVAKWWVRGLVLGGLTLGAIALSQFLQPASQEQERLGLLATAAVALFGPRGAAVITLVPSLVLLYGARFIWRRTAKKPTDRLWW
jgi:H+/Cl- antiporter ClcA